MTRLVRYAALLSGLSWMSAASAQLIFVPVLAPPPPPEPMFALPGEPLAEWIDPALGSTASFARNCGHTAEVHLSSRPETNFASVVVRNHTGQMTEVTDSTRAVFDNGIERWLERRAGPPSIPSNQWELLTYAFPDKEDFAGQSKIRLVLALEQQGQPCELTAVLKRQPGVPDAPRSVIEYTPFNVYIGGGVGLSHSAGPETLPQHPGAVVLGMGVYPWVRHGLHFHMFMEFSGAGSGQRFAPNVPDSNLFSGMLSIGYAYRQRIAGPLQFGYRVGPGAGVLQAAEGGTDGGPLATEYALGLAHSVHLDLSWLTPLDPSPVGFGLAAYHLYVPSAELSAVAVDGHRLGLVLLLNVGG